MWIDGQLMLSEADVVKMCVVLVPVIWTVVVFLAGWIVEEVRNYRSGDLFKDEEAQDILKKVPGGKEMSKTDDQMTFDDLKKDSTSQGNR